MASEASEALADIVAEMRYGAIPKHQTDHELLALYAGRIEAAWKRQCSQSWHHREMEELILQHEKEVAELKKLIDAAVYAYDPTKAGKSELPDGSAYALEAFKADKAKKPTTVGNAAAMREALESVRRDMWDLMGSSSESLREALALRINKTIRAALAAPPRNCDVGTPQEQAQRFMDFCRPGCHPPNCKECKVYPGRMNRFWCQLEWAQMPYEEGETR